jgi:hypothetical protein
VSVALVIGLALALTNVRGQLAGPAGSTAASGLPRYFAQFADTKGAGGSVEIRSVSTGAVVASAPSPRKAGWPVLADTMAAAPDGRTFYVAYIAQHAGISPQTWIYRFSTTGSRLTMIKGGVIPHSASTGLRGSMAVSPDGTKLALTVARPRHETGAGPGTLDKIVVVDLRTGARSGWEGGRAGFRAGWISQGKFHPLPIRQPYPAYPASFIGAW